MNNYIPRFKERTNNIPVDMAGGTRVEIIVLLNGPSYANAELTQSEEFLSPSRDFNSSP